MAQLRITHLTATLAVFLIYSNLDPKVSALKTIRLSSGHDMPIIGLGTGQMRPENVDVAVTAALENGYRHIDTAFIYGNEDAIGKTLKKWFDKGNKRESLFITTKLPPYGMRPQAIEFYLKLSLEKLGIEYVDMYLLHKPFGFVKDKYKHQPAINPNGTAVLDLDTDHAAIWKAMETQVKAGRVRSIGICNMNKTQLLNVYDNAEIKPSNLQIELQAYNQQQQLREFCAERNITITSFSTMGSYGTPDNKRTEYTKTLPRLFEHPVVKKLAKNHNRTTAQILLRHVVQSGIVVIPKSTHPERIKQNIAIFDFALSELEMKEMNGLDKGDKGRFFNLFHDKVIEKHPQYPFASQIMTENTL